ncbi:hypothetical protein BD770DRAFT_446811 [Pilaira anomala]|nr:hypothetical protein BD770DRAFT_446811 [Pilaira anomala]
MINRESEDVIYTRLIEGYSTDISGLADLPQACEEPVNFTSSEGNENNVVEETTYTMPVPEFVTSAKRYNSFDFSFEEVKRYTDSLCINATITSSNWEKKEGEERQRKYGIIQCHKSRESSNTVYVVKGTPGSRNGRSARCSCPFKWTINRKQSEDKDGKKYYYYFIKAINNQHNHMLHTEQASPEAVGKVVLGTRILAQIRAGISGISVQRKRLSKKVGNSLALKIISTIAPAIKKVKDCIDEYNALAADPERMGLSITDKSAMWVQWCRATEETEILKGEICRLSSYTRSFEKRLNDALLKHPLSSLEQEKEKEDWNRRTADDLSQVLGTPMDNDAYFNDE